MYKSKYLAFTIAITLASTIISIDHSWAAKTGTTGWVNGYEAIRLGRSKERRNIVPTKISCKNGKSDRGDFRKNMLIKVDYRIRDKKNEVDWVAAWHTAMKQFEIRYGRQGFKMVSRDSYVRATGLRVHCALWHRPRKN